MDTPIPENEYVPMALLEKYIEQYPEDVEKVYNIIKDQTPDMHRRTVIHDNPGEEHLNKLREFHNTPPGVPIDNHTDGCLFCKKSWVSTQEQAKMTLLCGHSYHTYCSYLDQYNEDYTQCLVEGCNIDTWSCIRTIARNNEKTKESIENVLIKSYKKNKGFKAHVKELKSDISNVSKAISSVHALMKQEHNEVVHKHLYSINEIQADLNNVSMKVKESEQMARYKEVIRKYRRNAALMNRKYHLSFRDLNRNNILKCSWNLRRVVERHRNPFSYYRSTIRIRIGKKVWKDPL